ncbi:hypothetical protein GOQ29_07735 [Clostridium sp. D2Q-14]|uniref:hypothetical protein n=1 Tax=Anaeromonas gelatinilytica TaxID=2683194 RepID=UPI00193C708D|nr:hypothetical protein [Anaeromonas gelatinilytica]MBS4535511.1 hypothetical protein [Anaeromonas gelatinilytica]
MSFNIKLPEKKLYIILILCAIIICLNSIEVMMNVKDIELYEEWISNQEDIEDYELYVTWNLSYYFIKIIIPMVFGIYTYFASKYIRINRIYVYIWSILLLVSFIISLIELKFDSIFYYISILSYIILIFTLLYLIKFINNRENS